MKKVLIMMMCALLLTGCGKKEVEEAPVVEEIEIDIEKKASEEDSNENSNENKNENDEKDVKNEKEDEPKPEKTNEEIEHANELLGSTFEELKEKGIAFTGYLGLNGEYTFSAGSEEKAALYNLGSTEAAAIMETLEIGEDWEEKIGDCVVDKVDVTLLDPNLLENMVGKTLNDVLSEGFRQNGYMGYSNLLITDGTVTVSVSLDDSCEEIYNSYENPDGDDFYKMFGECTIEEAEYW